MPQRRELNPRRCRPSSRPTAGKVRGVISNGVHVYRGIPHGASTAGANRFMPPRKPEPWTGVRDAFQNGHSSPQVAPAPGAIGWGLRGSAAQGEDCLVLNVFSTGVNDGAQTSRDDVDPRRRLRLRIRIVARLRRRESRPRRRCRGRLHQPSPRASSGICISARRRRRASRIRRNVGMLDIVAVAAMGARQHRAVRRRSRAT